MAKATQPTDKEALQEELLERARAVEGALDEVLTEALGQSTDDGLAVTDVTYEDAGYVTLYDTRTGLPSVHNRNMLAIKLRERRDGRAVWTSVDPGFRPKPGTYKCRLHEEDPERETWDGYGFSVCPKANLLSEYQMERHMMKKHKDEWTVMSERKYRKEAEEQKEINRRLMELLVDRATGKDN